MKRLLFLCLCVANLSACDSAKTPQINLGQAAPAFQGQRLGGGGINFPAEFAGRPVVIRFWADWCHYCEGEMKDIEPIYQRYRGQGLEVLAVNAGQDADTVAAFGKKIGTSYPLLVDDKAAVARQYGVLGLPTSYFIDGQGVIRAKIVGEASAETFEKNLHSVLKP